MSEPNEIPKNTKNTAKPYKKDVFDAYATWRSIPACMRNNPANEMAKELTAEDALFGELLKVRNQSEFAQKYGVENSTLTNWNKLIEKNDPFSEVRMWGKKFTKDVLFALYRHTLETGDAESVRLWLQVIEKWTYQKGKAEIPERKYEPVKFTIIENLVSTK